MSDKNFTNEDAEQLLRLIEKAVTADGSWKNKSASIKDAASDSDLTNLVEFATWFIDDE